MKDDQTKIAFKTSQGLYLSCQPDGSLRTDRAQPNSWETFQVYKSDFCPNRPLGYLCFAIKSAYTDNFRKTEMWIRATRTGELKCDLDKFQYVSQLFYSWTTKYPKVTETIKFDFVAAKW